MKLDVSLGVSGLRRSSKLLRLWKAFEWTTWLVIKLATDPQSMKHRSALVEEDVPLALQRLGDQSGFADPPASIEDDQFSFGAFLQVAADEGQLVASSHEHGIISRLCKQNSFRFPCTTRPQTAPTRI